MKSKLTGADVSRQSQNHTIIKGEMEYASNRGYALDSGYTPTLLARGKHKGYPFAVINYNGNHPCAYVYLPAERQEYPDVHGGITYTAHYPNRPHGTVNTKHRQGGVWVGWDYAHSSDYQPILADIAPRNKRWTTKEIVEEVKRFIEELDNE